MFHICKLLNAFLCILFGHFQFNHITFQEFYQAFIIILFTEILKCQPMKAYMHLNKITLFTTGFRRIKNSNLGDT